MYFSLFRNNFQVIFPHFVGLKSRSSLKKKGRLYVRQAICLNYRTSANLSIFYKCLYFSSKTFLFF